MIRLVHLDGRIGKDGAELKQTVAGKPYLRFSLANNIYIGGQEKTEWFDVKVFDPFIIENKAKFLTKGTFVYVVGSWQTEVNVDKNNKVWVNQYVTATFVDTPTIGSKKDGNDIVNMSSGMSITTQNIAPTVETPQVQQSTAQPTSMEPELTTGVMTSDDLPF